MSESGSSGGRIGLSGAVFLIFLTLKLLEIEPVASWSWWWVTSPLWIGLAFFLFLLLFAAGSVGATRLIEKLFAGKTVKLEDEDDE